MINQKYRKSPESLVNYDFVDKITNQGSVSVYGNVDTASGAILTRQPLASAYPYTDVGGADANLEINFDYTFNVPLLVKGKLYVTETYGADNTASATALGWTTLEPIHVDGVTANETSMAAAVQTKGVTNPADTARSWERVVAGFDVDKQFKKGDKLRIEVIIHVEGTTTNATTRLCNDGANRDLGQEAPAGTPVDSTFVVDIPFDLGGIL